MRMYDIIQKKRDGFALGEEEIRFFIDGYTRGEIPDYQAAALLMAVYLKGMTLKETADLTRAVSRSGDTVDLSGIEGIKADKHSTGGVGDKTTLIVAPLAAACGVKIAKMSGRGLGHTGGTVDKLESIPGFRTDLSRAEFIAAVNRTGIAVVGQSGDLAPADKKLYALRDVTATVDSPALIAASIMGKKLAAGADIIVLDVKTGSGAFMKTPEEAESLASLMVGIGNSAGKKTAAVISDMSVPLGCAIGNALEVKEAVRTLKGEGPADLTELCVLLAATILSLATEKPAAQCREEVSLALSSGRAFAVLREMVLAQGGDAACLDDFSLLPAAAYRREVLSQREGYLTEMNAEAYGKASVLLGAGRSRKEDVIDHAAGIEVMKKTGDFVRKGETLAVLHASDTALFGAAEREILSALSYASEKPAKKPLVYKMI